MVLKVVLSGIIDRLIVAINFYNHNQNVCIVIVATCLCKCVNWKMATQQLLHLKDLKVWPWSTLGSPARDESFWRLIKRSVTVFTCKLCGKVRNIQGTRPTYFTTYNIAITLNSKLCKRLDSKERQGRLMKMKDLRQGRSVDSFKATTTKPKSSPRWNKFNNTIKSLKHGTAFENIKFFND